MSRVLCLGEAVVDFIAEPPCEQLADAQAFLPSFGGSQANVAVGATRLGAASALAGRAGRDPWGAWLRDRLAWEGVDVSLYELSEGVSTTMAFVTVGADGEPRFAIYGGTEKGMLAGTEERLLALVSSGTPGVIVFGSDTLLAESDRDTIAALAQAGASRGWRVLYDPNLREARWSEPDLMVAVAAGVLGGVTVVKANRHEATLLTGEDDPRAAARALLVRGARQAVVTLAGDGAILAGPAGTAHFPAETVREVDATGAGDAVAAVIAAALARSERVEADTMRTAMRVAGGVVGERGALTGFRAPDRTRAWRER